MWTEAFQLEFFFSLSSMFIISFYQTRKGNMESIQFQLPHLAQQEQAFGQNLIKLNCLAYGQHEVVETK